MMTLDDELEVEAALTESFDVIRKELEEEIARLTGKICLICGAKEPCELFKGEMSPCTFDPHPIEAAVRFLRRAEAAEAKLAQVEREIERVAKRYEDEEMHILAASLRALTAAGQK